VLLCPFPFSPAGVSPGQQYAMTKAPPTTERHFFHLQDGSDIKSFSGNHHRICAVYLILGEVVRKNQSPRNFEGVVGDADIAEITVDKLSVAGTVLVCVLGGLAIAVASIPRSMSVQ